METEKRGRGRPKGSKNNVMKEGTAEIAKNLEAEVRILCTACNKEFKLQECLKEEPMPPPYETVLEGYILCPSCGDRKHSYYLSELVRFRQARLNKALLRWHETQDKKDWRAYKTLYDQFRRSFDSAQKRYKEIFGKETTSEPRG